MSEVRVLALDPNSLPQYCSEGNVQMVKDLLENGAEVNRPNKDGVSALHMAVQSKNIECIEILLEHDAFVDPLDTNGNSPLHYAAEYGVSDIIDSLVTAAIRHNPDSKDFTDKTSESYLQLASSYVGLPNLQGNSALHIASSKGFVNCIDCLISYGASVDAVNEKGFTPLHCGAISGFDEVLDVLLDEDADINATDDDGNIALHLSAMYGHCDCVTFLSGNCDIMTQNIDGLTPLHLACLNGHLDVVSLFLTGTDDWESYNDVDIEDEFGRTPLHAAASSSNIKICQLLLKSGADLKKVDEDGRTALIWIVNQCHPKQGDGLILQCLQQFWKWWDLDSSGPENDHQDETGKNVLHYACYHGLSKCVRFLISKKFDINLQDSCGRTPLHYAMSSFTCTKTLLSYKLDISVSDHEGAKPIHIAGYFSNASVIEELLKVDAKCITSKDEKENTLLHYLASNINISQRIANGCMEFLLAQKRELLDLRNIKGQTAIHVASSCGNIIFLETLQETVSKLELSFYFKAKDENGRSPAHLAAMNGHADVFLFLINNGADTTALDSSNVTPLHLAVLRHQIKFLHKVIDFPININAGDNEGRSAFFYACRNGFVDIMDAMIIGDIDLDGFVDNNGNSALHIAVEGSRSASVKFILDEEPDEDLVNKPNNMGLTPVHIASVLDSSSCLQELLQYEEVEIDIDCVDKNGRTALHFACMYGNAQCASLLIEKGANVNVKDNSKNSPLFYSSYGGHLPCISLLLKNGAKITDINSEGRSVLHAAAWCGSIRACETLIEASPPLIDKTCSNGRTALHRAVSRDHVKLVQYLIETSADIEAADSDGATPIMLACFYQKIESVKCLLELNASTDGVDELERSIEDYTKKGANVLGDSSNLETIISLISS